jgi:hypothetical protein
VTPNVAAKCPMVRCRLFHGLDCETLASAGTAPFVPSHRHQRRHSERARGPTVAIVDVSKAVTLKCPARGHDECKRDISTVDVVNCASHERELLDRLFGGRASLYLFHSALIGRLETHSKGHRRSIITAVRSHWIRVGLAVCGIAPCIWVGIDLRQKLIPR